MKVTDEVEQLRKRATSATQLRQGDSITTGVTHEILINGDKSWVKFECTTVVGEGENATEAKHRAIDYVSLSVLDAVKAAVNTVNEVN